MMCKVFSPTTYMFLVFGKSVQFGHLYHKLQNKSKRNSTRKRGTMFPLSRVKVSHLMLFFCWKKTSYMHHCNKQMRNLSQLETHLNILKITYLAVYWLSRGILPSLPSINGSEQYFHKIIECFWRKNCCSRCSAFSNTRHPLELWWVFCFESLGILCHFQVKFTEQKGK